MHVYIHRHMMGDGQILTDDRRGCVGRDVSSSCEGTELKDVNFRDRESLPVWRH